jgi:hypothetical protein
VRRALNGWGAFAPTIADSVAISTSARTWVLRSNERAVRSGSIFPADPFVDFGGSAFAAHAVNKLARARVVSAIQIARSHPSSSVAPTRTNPHGALRCRSAAWRPSANPTFGSCSRRATFSTRRRTLLSRNEAHRRAARRAVAQIRVLARAPMLPARGKKRVTVVNGTARASDDGHVGGRISPRSKADLQATVVRAPLHEGPCASGAHVQWHPSKSALPETWSLPLSQRDHARFESEAREHRANQALRRTHVLRAHPLFARRPQCAPFVAPDDRPQTRA